LDFSISFPFSVEEEEEVVAVAEEEEGPSMYLEITPALAMTTSTLPHFLLTSSSNHPTSASLCTSHTTLSTSTLLPV
jgi:hypothetical protein